VTAVPPSRAPSRTGADDGPSRRVTYLTVILVQVIALLGLWVFQSHFGR
jgi:hypothetical protein